MIALGFTFPTGRFHATGWDHHVNEGTVEWPPSPWRILRALVAASYRVQPPPDPALTAATLERLAALPSYRLPPTREGHTRHYMPAPVVTTKVFDAFRTLEPHEELIVVWQDAVLDERGVAVLAALAEALCYLGRAESRVEARVIPAVDGPFDAVPAGPGDRGDRVLLMAAEEPDRYQSWLRAWGSAQGTRPGSRPPVSWWDVLHQDTALVHKAGWSAPPGTRMVEYAVSLPSGRRRMQGEAGAPAPRLARFAIASPVLPPITEAVALGDRLRDALMSRSGRSGARLPLSVFSGRAADGTPLQGQQHAFYLSEDADGDGFIDHFVVWSRQGFGRNAVDVLRDLRRLWGSAGHDLHLALVALLTDAPEEWYAHGRRAAPAGVGSTLLGPSREWVSVTPMVLSRHPKVRAASVVDTPEDQARSGLEWLGLPAPTEVLRLREPVRRGRARHWYDFRRRRLDGGGSRAGDEGLGFRLRFAEPVRGPIALGYGAHHGLGVFEAV